jgi:hypothetical protein
MKPVRGVVPIRGVFGSLALLWPAALVAATRIAAVPHRGDAAYLLSAAVYFSGSLLCHQRPERSFSFWGTQFPVCARCAGIYAGAALGVIAELVRLKSATASAAVTPLVASGSSRSSAVAFARAFRRPPRELTILVAASLPAAVTLVFEWTTGVTPTNGIRALSGLLLGAAAAVVVMRAGDAPSGEVN